MANNLNAHCIPGTFPPVGWSNKRGRDALISLLRLFGGPLGSRTSRVRQTAIMKIEGGRNGFDGDVDARGLRAEALHLVKSGKPIVANDYPLAQAA